MPTVWSRLSAAAALFVVIARADQYVYLDDSLSSGWENWSWSSTINFAATDGPASTSGTSLSVKADPWSALSFKESTGSFSSYAGLKFDIAGAQPGLQIYFESTDEGLSSSQIPLSALKTAVTTDKFTTFTLDFSALPPSGAPLGSGKWNRINFQALGDGAAYYLDNVVLVDSIVIKPLFLSAEPLASNVVAVTAQGAVDLSSVKVSLNGKNIAIKSNTTVSAVDIPSKQISYFTLATDFGPGNLTITATNATFTYDLPKATTGGLGPGLPYPINPRVYGVNFPTSASYIQHLGVPLSRRGGNAETAYNPNGDFTNAGNDWYFENRPVDSTDSWVGWVSGAGSETMLLLPALDWVAKDGSSYSYPKTIYPDQAAFNPYHPDEGNGKYANGSFVSPPPDPRNAYTPWNTTLAAKYLQGMKNKPTIVTIDNEIEIASETHQDMHPVALGYDEIFKRYIDFGTVAKKTLPAVQVAAPSTCAWWFYWTSRVGQDDKTAHNGSDFLPWFLDQAKKHDKATGKRLLDYLDIHYYFGADTSSNSAAAKATRLRMSRSLWDPTYIDESYIGTQNPPFNTQPNPFSVMLIPRMHNLIDKYYPGTKLSIGEWSTNADGELTGGLLAVDVLGLFGKYKLDAATYWATPDEKGPVGTAYWLYRGYGRSFGSMAIPVTINGVSPDLIGVYAATSNPPSPSLSLVIVNKDPAKAVTLSLVGVPPGNYFMRHFGGGAGVAKYQTNVNVKGGPAQYIVVPAYTAVFLQQNL